MRLLSSFLVALLALAAPALAQVDNGRVSTAAPSYTNGTTAPFSLTTAGAIRIDLATIAGTAAATVAGSADGTAAATVGISTSTLSRIFNGTTWDRQRSVINATNSTGTGIAAAGILGQFDDVSPTAITENQFGNLRMSANRNAYTTIRDAAGNERGVNVTSGNALTVDGSAVTQPVSAASLPLPSGAATSANQTNGTQKTQIVDGSGNVIASTSNNLNVQCANCSGSGASAADEASFTAGTSTFAPSGCFFQTTPTSNALTTGQQGEIQCTANRAPFVNLRNASGTEIGTSTTPVQVSLANTGANSTAVKVDGSAVTQPVSVSGTLSTNEAQINGVAPSMGNGVSGTGVQRVTIASDSTGQVALAAGTNTVGNVVLVPSATAGGTSLYTLTAAASTNAANVKASAGQVYAISGYTISATPAWLSLYNTAGTPTCGTSIIQQFLIPGSTSGAGFNISFPLGKAFSTGIGVCLTTGIAGTGAVAASSYVINVDYK